MFPKSKIALENNYHQNWTSSSFDFILTLCLFLLFNNTLRSQQFQFSNLSLNDGLAQSQVYSIAEDHKAYLWMATNGGGLSRFDGMEFQTYSEKDGLSSNYIHCLLADQNEKLWIGCSNGLNVFEGDSFKTIKSDFSKLKITALESFTKDSILVGTNQGLYSIKDSVLIPFSPNGLLLKGDVSRIKKGPSGDLWIASDAGLAHLRDGEIQYFNKKNGLSGNLVRSLCFDTLGGLWVGTYGNGINYIKDDKISQAPGLDINEKLIANDLYLYDSSLLWIATVNHGICIYNPSDSSFSQLKESSGLANDFVNTFFKDSWGNYWIGTSGGGISKYSGQQFQIFNRNNGLKGNYIYALEGRGDSLWLSSSAGGVSLFKDNKALRYGQDSGFTDTKVKAIYQAKNGVVYLGTEGSGMALFNGDTFVFYTTRKGSAGNWVKDIIEDDKGRIWLATSGGGISCLSHFDSLGSPVFRNYRQSHGLASNRIIHLHKDSIGRIWYASRFGGLGYIQNDSIIKNFKIRDGLLSETIRSIDEDRQGRLWIGSNKGLNILSIYKEDAEVLTFQGNDNLTSLNIYLLKFDALGNLWLGSEKGLDKFNLDEQGRPLEFFHYGLEEGFTGLETNINSVHSEPNGDMWFGTINGLQKYLSEVRISNQKAPVLNFTSINLDYTDYRKTQYFRNNSQGIKFPYHENNLTFEFIGITQTVAKKVAYKWILEGMDNKWSPVSKMRSVNFSNLKPGVYNFKVLSVNENGVWNEKPIEFPFTIEKPVWKEDWFILSYILFGIIILLLIFTLRFRSIKRKSKAKQEKISMEKDLLILEQKALRLQMNPHFIFHTLNSIQALIATKEEEVAREYLSKFSRLMRQILENSRQNEISLDAEIETLENYLAIEKFVNEDSFEYEFSIPEDIEREFIKIPPMIIQPFIENSIIHGINHLEAKMGKIKIEFRDLQDVLECSIEDNGVGRKKSAQINKTSNRLHQSTALAVTSERLEFLSSGKSCIEIQDLIDEKGNSRGTKLVLRIPILEN